ncbi:MAG: ornithine carbamoyltransferase [Desulfurococcales archaeon ex4484_204]|nr:MAG: ornithine carbamoyltransferase [Desulfurococcales archaeon ex4484_204]
MFKIKDVVTDLTGKDLITTQEWSVDEIRLALELARDIKKRYIFYGVNGIPKLLERKTFFMLFFAPSTRTRSAFEAAMTLLGGHAQYLEPRMTRAGEGEALKDIAKMYERYGHGLGIRILDKAIDYVYGRGNVVIRETAKWAKVPVINMADDMFHPTQGLADYLTFEEAFPKPRGKKYVIMWAYSPEIRGWCSIQEDLLIFTKATGASLEFSNDFKAAVEGAHAVFPRNWASPKLVQVGYSKFAEEERRLYEKFRDWRVSRELFDRMDKSAVLMHVMPIFRGYEADEDVIDSPRSLLYEQAENGLYTKAAVLALTMAGMK